MTVDGEEEMEFGWVNESGFIPVEYKVLVLPDVPKEQIGSIFVPETVRDKEKHRAVKAILVAVGGDAFEDWTDPIPEIGDSVYVAVGAGLFYDGVDGRVYRIINDKDIAGIVTGDGIREVE
jgi:co-chaperonin GroES (HSP10)